MSCSLLMLILACSDPPANVPEPAPSPAVEVTHEAHAHDEDPVHGADRGEPAPTEPVQVALGPSVGTLTPSEGSLTLSIVDQDGTPQAPTGVVRILLTPTGGTEQKVQLVPDGDRWKGSAQATGAVGYTAVVVAPSAEGATVTGRATWGTVPATKAAPAAPSGGGAED